jgi:hypothetical protein
VRPPDLDTLWDSWLERVGFPRLCQKFEDWLARRQTAPAQAPVPVPQPVAKADLKAMSPEELEAEKEKIMAEIKG